MGSSGGPTGIPQGSMDPCLELTLFEKDVEKMFEWIRSNRDLFMSKYTRIGRSSSETEELQDEHEYFYAASMNVYVKVKRLQEVAQRLVTSGHFAASRIGSIASRLDRGWKEFASSLEERTKVLQLALIYYQNSESFIRSVPNWSKDLELTPSTVIPTDVTRLEEMVHRHQNLFDAVNKYYEEVHSCRKKLLYQLEHFVQFCFQCKFAVAAPTTPNQPPSPSGTGTKGRNPSQDYNDAAKHVSSMIHEVMSGYRALESVWQMKKMKLHQKLALALFQDDVRQVLEWIEVHGEGFLKKNLTIGKNLQRARGLQKSHEHFESVARNTYTNGAKLLAAAEEFAQTGECNPDEIYRVARHLDSQIRMFSDKVERRKQLLHLSTLFYTHDKDISTWIEEMRRESGPSTDSNQHNHHSMEAPASVDSCEAALEQCKSQKKAMSDAVANTITEGETLLQILRDTLNSGDLNDGASNDGGSHHGTGPSEGRDPSPTHSSSDTLNRNTRQNISHSIVSIESIIEKLKRIRPEMEELSEKRKMRLELCLQLRLFERDALRLCNQFEGFADGIESCQRKELMNSKKPLEVPVAEDQLRLHNDSFTRMQQMACDFLQRGQELQQLFESCTPSITVYADFFPSDQREVPTHDASSNTPGTNGSKGSNGSNSRTSTALQRIQAILEYVREREMDLEDLADVRRARLEETRSFSQLGSDASQVLRWMRNGESMLAASFLVPTSLREAEDLQVEHEQFQMAIEVCIIHNHSHYSPLSFHLFVMSHLMYPTDMFYVHGVI